MPRLFSTVAQALRRYELTLRGNKKFRVENAGPGSINPVLGDSYENQGIAQVVVAKTLRAISEIETGTDPTLLAKERYLAAFLAATLRGSQAPNVLDFGGGGGLYYHLVSRLVPNEEKLRWNLVETPAMVEVLDSHCEFGSNLFAFTSISEFQHSMKSGQPLSLVYANASLQYVQEPLETCYELSRLGAEKIFLARATLSQRKTIRATQTSLLSENGPGPLLPGIEDRPVTYPITFVSFRELQEAIGPDYALTSRVSDKCLDFIVGGEIIETEDLLFHRR